MIRISSGSAGNLGRLPVLRWDRFPLSVWSEDPDLAPLIEQALKAWAVASPRLIWQWGGPNADVRWVWTPEPMPAKPHEVGHTQPIITPQGRLQSVTVKLVAKTAIDKQLNHQQQAERLWATILHEWGHALGLDHSFRADQIMHPQGWRNQQPGSEDLLRLRTLYP